MPPGDAPPRGHGGQQGGGCGAPADSRSGATCEAAAGSTMSWLPGQDACAGAADTTIGGRSAAPPRPPVLGEGARRADVIAPVPVALARV
jgi:hypothetical protein